MNNNYEILQTNDVVLCFTFFENLILVGVGNEIQIFDFYTKKLIKKLNNHEENINYLSIYNKFLISGSEDKLIIIFNIEKNYDLIKIIKKKKNDIKILFINNNELICEQSNRKILILDINNNFKKRKINFNDIIVKSVFYKNYIICSLENDDIKIYDINNNFKLEKIITEHTDLVYCLLIYNDYLITGSWDKTIKIFHILDDFNLIRIIKEHDDIIYCLLVYNNILISGSWDKTIKLFDLKNNFKLIKIIEDFDDIIYYLDIYNNYLISGYGSGKILFQNINKIINQKSLENKEELEDIDYFLNLKNDLKINNFDFIKNELLKSNNLKEEIRNIYKLLKNNNFDLLSQEYFQENIKLKNELEDINFKYKNWTIENKKLKKEIRKKFISSQKFNININNKLNKTKQLIYILKNEHKLMKKELIKLNSKNLILNFDTNKFDNNIENLSKRNLN